MTISSESLENWGQRLMWREFRLNCGLDVLIYEWKGEVFRSEERQ